MTRPRVATVTADQYRRLPSEAEMLAAITDLVTLKGGRLWHLHDARTAPELVDLWDTTAILPGGLLVCLEVKSQARPFESAGQEAVCRMLESVGRVVTGVVRPVPKPGEYSYDEVLDILRGW